MATDISDIYIKGTTDPFYNETQIETTTFLDTVISKMYVILMTNKGDVLGNPDFGADIPKYLWKTSFPATTIQDSIKEQFEEHIPELSTNDYIINVYILSGTVQDIGIINIDLGVNNVNIIYK
jgi:hypothetical protein